MTTWFTSDLHLGHKNIIKYCRRPFAVNVEAPTRAEVTAMNAALVDNWNAVVGPEDEVWMLGDFAFCCAYEDVEESWAALAGVKHVVTGNHEETLRLVYERHPSWFASWTEGHRMLTMSDGQEIWLDHYASRQWLRAEAGAWHLFGHTHAALRPFGKSVDVGVDNTLEILHHTEPMYKLAASLYRPVSFQEVKAFMDHQPIGPHPVFAGAQKSREAVAK